MGIEVYSGTETEWTSTILQCRYIMAVHSVSVPEYTAAELAAPFTTCYGVRYEKDFYTELEKQKQAAK